MPMSWSATAYRRIVRSVTPRSAAAARPSTTGRVWSSSRNASRRDVGLDILQDSTTLRTKSVRNCSYAAGSIAHPIVGGLGNVDSYSAPDFPGRPGFEGFTLCLFEPKTGLWRIWWASSIGSGQLDEPVVGRFEDGGVGRFECDDLI